MHAIANPFTMSRAGDDPLVRRWGPAIRQHVEGFEAAIASRASDPDSVRKRVRLNQMLMIAEGTAFQAQTAVRGVLARIGHTQASYEAWKKAAMAGEAAAHVNVLADITDFVTQNIHTALSIFPRMLATQLVSIQPLLQPMGYVFAVTHTDEADRDLSDLDTFDPDFTEDPGEGESIEKIKTKVTKTLVEAEYRKLGWEESHEMNVALQTQYGMSSEALNDNMLGHELMWETDRAIIDRLTDFAGEDYYFDPDDGGNYAGKDDVNKAAYDNRFLRETWNQAETDMQDAIFQKPNWAIGGKDAIAFLGRLKVWEAYKQGKTMGDTVISTGRIALAGFVNNMPVWHDPQLDNDLILMGYTDNMNPFYAGYIYCPFGAASILTASFTDPDNLLTRKGAAIAFATHGVKAAQYARVWVRAES